MPPPLIDLAIQILFAASGGGLLGAVFKLILERQRQNHDRKLEKQRQDHARELEKQRQVHERELEKQRHRTAQQLLRIGALADLQADGSVSTLRGEVSGLRSAPSEVIAQGQIISLPQRQPEQDDP